MPLLPLLYAALRAEHGIIVECTTPLTEVRQKLYAARRKQDDPALSALSFLEGPDGNLWIVKTRKDPLDEE